MKHIRMVLIAAFIATLLGCGAGKNSALVGQWVSESEISPISVITFDGKVCTFKDALLGNTTEYQYQVDSKEGVLNLYKIGADMKTAQPARQKFSVNGYTLQLPGANGPLTFRRK